MIIDAQSSSVEITGDIKEFKTSIDPRNLELITTILSSNLYSKPEESFIRETVSNAWDSHVEAGTTDIPILINIDRNTRSVTIRDFGTGISPERFKEIYCNIGSSTKRESNEYIGGFGLGRFSALACSNTVYITSFYNGLEYHYIMIKDGNTITTNLVATLNTEERNGVEITIKDIVDFSKFKYALQAIVFFPNIYISSSNGEFDYINNTKIRHHKYYAVVEGSASNTAILLGKVLYHIDRSQISNTDILGCSYIYGVALKFDIGELKVTPNREAIIYDKKTIKLIEDRLEKANNELKEVIYNSLTHDYSNIGEYYKAISYKLFNVFKELPENKITYNSLSINDTMIEDYYTYKGTHVNPLFFNALVQTIPGEYIGKILPGKIKALKTSRIHDIIISDKTVFIPKDTRLTKYLKSFLIDNYIGYQLSRQFSFKEYKEFILEALDIKEDPAKSFIIKDLYDHYISNGVLIDPKTNKEYLDYINNLKKSNKLNEINSYTPIVVYCSYPKIAYTKVTSIKDLISVLRSFKQGIIIDSFKNASYSRCRAARSYGYNYIILRDCFIKKLDNVYLPNRVDPKSPKMLRRFNRDYTATRYLTNSEISRFIDILPAHIYSEVTKLIEKSRKKDPEPLLEKYIEDPYVKYLTDEVLKYRRAIENLEDRYELNEYNSGDFEIILYLLVRDKHYRIPFSTFDQARNNKLIKALCKK